MDHEHIYLWRAKRAGGRITIYGHDQDGKERRIPNVDEIAVTAATNPRVEAVDKDGIRYVLVVA